MDGLFEFFDFPIYLFDFGFDLAFDSQQPFEYFILDEDSQLLSVVVAPLNFGFLLVEVRWRLPTERV